MDVLESLQQSVGYQFREQSLLLQALTHRSAGARHNERLEFLGDAALNFVVAAKLFAPLSQGERGGSVAPAG